MGLDGTSPGHALLLLAYISCLDSSACLRSQRTSTLRRRMSCELDSDTGMWVGQARKLGMYASFCFCFLRRSRTLAVQAFPRDQLYHRHTLPGHRGIGSGPLPCAVGLQNRTEAATRSFPHEVRFALREARPIEPWRAAMSAEQAGGPAAFGFGLGQRSRRVLNANALGIG